MSVAAVRRVGSTEHTFPALRSSPARVAQTEFSVVSHMVAAVLILPPGMHPQLEQRYDLTCHLLEQEHVSSYVVDVQGPTPLCQMLTGTYFGDWVSFYLAMAQGIDPSPIPPIDYIKSQLG